MKSLVAILTLAAVLASASPVRAGAIGGPKVALQQRVGAFSIDTYNVRFAAGHLAEVVLVGDGDTDLDLYVYDEFGNLIASDADYSDDCLASWVPRWTGAFTIKVVNLGEVYNEYTIETN